MMRSILGGSIGMTTGSVVTSDLAVGDVVRVPMPPLTEQRRKELVKVVRHEGEAAKIAVRNLRRDANHHVKELLKAKEVSEDEDRRAEETIQKLTDRYVSEIDKLIAEKEKEVMTV